MGHRRRVAAGRRIFACVLAGMILGHADARGQGMREPSTPTSLLDIRLARLRRASLAWEARRGPARQVVDQVVLVGDLPGFYEAIAAWDQSHWFPVLWEDAEFAPKFLRAFRPARVVRIDPAPGRVRAESSWEAASQAVERSWASRDEENRSPPPTPLAPRTVAVPARLGKTPPGVVLAAPDSPGLMAAVALAAGRFQTMVPWLGKAPREPDEAQAGAIAAELEKAVGAAVPRYAALGDDCDFLTLAADLPAHYRIAGGTRNGQSASGLAALDDRLGRDRQARGRWAFAGRIEGDAVASLYRAMCSLFLQPRSALLFDTYDLGNRGFAAYKMNPAAAILGRSLATVVMQDENADLAGWHRAFGRTNTQDMVYVNSSGGPNSFSLKGGQGGTAVDLPAGVPAIVLMNHSFSAADPRDPDTLAGRWLANGAFLYFGSMNEPFLQAFRTPRLVADLMTEGLPLSACVRMVPEEDAAWGLPWRLTFLGDPLYRLDRGLARAARLDRWKDVDSWKPIENAPLAPKDATNEEILEWSRQAALLNAAGGDPPPARKALEAALLKPSRPNLRAGLRPLYDHLLIDAMSQAWPRVAEVQARLAAIDPADRSPEVARTLEAATARERVVEPRER